MTTFDGLSALSLFSLLKRVRQVVIEAGVCDCAALRHTTTVTATTPLRWLGRVPASI